MDWKKIVGTVAPTIATTLGGPLVGTAVRTISRAVFGRDDASEDDIAAALAKADSSTLAKIQAADKQFQLEMEKLGIEVKKIEAADRDSARRREEKVGGRANSILASVVIVGFFAAVGFVLSGKINMDGEAGILIGTMIGYVSAKADQVVSYYFGSSASSQRKTELLGAQK